MDPLHVQLSRRERQIMDAIYARGGSATAEEVRADLPDPPSNTAVRTMLRVLEHKGHLRHRKRGKAFVYQPVRPKGPAALAALRRVLHTFYQGSLEQALAAHLNDPREGTFVIDHVPAVPLIVSVPRVAGKTRAMRVDPAPGRTTQVQIGGPGHAISGLLHLPTGLSP